MPGTSAASTSSSGWSSATELQGRKNMALCQEILDCQQQLTVFRTRLTKLKAEHKKQVQLQAVKVQAKQAWPALSRKDKWKKLYLLAALNHSPDLPKQLREDLWEQRVPKHLRHDPDLIIARLQRPEFIHYYRCGGRVFTIPVSLRNNKEVVMQTVQHYPEILLHMQCKSKQHYQEQNDNNIEPQFLDDFDVLRALLKGCVANKNHGSSGGYLPQMVPLFSERVRSDANIMLEVLQRDAFCLSAVSSALRNDTAFAMAFANLNNKSKNDNDDDDASNCDDSANYTIIINRSETDASAPRFSINDATRTITINSDETYELASATILSEQQQQEQHDPAPVPVPVQEENDDEYDDEWTFPSDALKSFSSRLRADKQVATAFCTRAGGNLAYCSYPLRRDLTLVLAAVHNDPLSLVYCIKSRAKKILSSDHRFFMLIFMQVVEAQEREEGKPDVCTNHRSGLVWRSKTQYALRQRLWRFCSPSLKQERDIVVMALAANCITSIHDIPERLKEDRSFWVEVLAVDPFRWFTMPDHFKNDRKLANLAVQNVRSHEGAAIVDAITDQFRGDPRYDRQALMTMARVFPFEHAVSYWPWANQMWDDKEILLQACRHDGDVLELVQMSLITDRDVIETALKRTPDALCFVPSFVQHLYPDLVAQAIRDTPQDELWDLYDMVDEDLWENREVALAWVGQGGDFLHDDFSFEMEMDQELFLLIAAHNPEDFWCASDDLLCQKEFMLKAVEIDGNLLRDASEDIVQDFDLALLAFAGTSDLVGQYMTGRVRDFQFLVEFAKKVRARVEVHEGFVMGVLCGTTKGTLPMSILSQGRETTFAYAKLIADFLGIPKDKELRLLRQASTSLATWGF
jgi:hypothetical protein